MRNFSDFEKHIIINFDIDSHINLQKNFNVAGNIFGGHSRNIIKFIELYYDSLKLFIKKKNFIGNDQNIFAYITFSYPEIVKLVYCKIYLVLMQYKLLSFIVFQISNLFDLVIINIYFFYINIFIFF